MNEPYHIHLIRDGQRDLCIAQVPADVPGAYQIAEDIARGQSAAGKCHMLDEEGVRASFTAGRRNPDMS